MSVKLISYTVPADPEIASNMMELTAYIARYQIHQIKTIKKLLKG